MDTNETYHRQFQTPASLPGELHRGRPASRFALVAEALAAEARMCAELEDRLRNIVGALRGHRPEVATTDAPTDIPHDGHIGSLNASTTAIVNGHERLGHLVADLEELVG